MSLIPLKYLQGFGRNLPLLIEVIWQYTAQTMVSHSVAFPCAYLVKYSLHISVFLTLSNTNTCTYIMSERMYLLLWLNIEIVKCLRQSPSPVSLDSHWIILKNPEVQGGHDKTRVYMLAPVIRMLPALMAVVWRLLPRASTHSWSCRGRHRGFALVLYCFEPFCWHNCAKM